MVTVRVIKWNGTSAEAHPDFDHTTWDTNAPDDILIVYVNRGGTWVELLGWSAYVLKQRQSDSKYFFGGFNPINLRAVDGDTWEIPIEQVITDRPEIKFGIEITNAQWSQVLTTQWV
jgi:hypothetical protein